MEDLWEKDLACALQCRRCDRRLLPREERILSVYDHQPICLGCKQVEEKQPDYETVSKQMIGQCLVDTEMAYSDRGGYCYYHFYPFTC